MGWFLLGLYFGWTRGVASVTPALAGPGGITAVGSGAISPLSSLTAALPSSIANLVPGASSPSTSALK